MKKMLKIMLFMSIIAVMIVFAGICSFAENNGDTDLLNYPIADSELLINDDLLVNDDLGDEILSDGAEFNPENYEYNIMLNGQYIEFGDAAPVNVKGRIMVPFRVILETLGADVQYDNQTRAITATLGDKIITFAVGKSELNINESGKNSIKQMDVVPYIDPDSDRTYVSSRFVSESLGYNVGWDSEEKTVIIIDFDSLFEGIDTDFSVINGFIKSVKSEKGAVYERAGDAVVDATINKYLLNLWKDASTDNLATEDFNFNWNISASIVSQNNEACIEAESSGNIKELIEALSFDKNMSQNERAIIDNINNLSVISYVNLDSRDVYFKTNIDSLISKKANENSWFKANIDGAIKLLKFDSLVECIKSGNLDSIESVFVAMKKDSEASMTINTYDYLSTIYNEIKCIVSDSAIKVKKSGKETVYTIDFSNLNDVMEFGEINGNSVIKVKKGEYTCDSNMTMSMNGLVNLSVKSNDSKVKTDKIVEKIPENSTIIDVLPWIKQKLSGISGLIRL